jgi:C-terminal processing protease CtpA/Prc
LVTLDNSHVGLNEKNLENFKLTRDIYCKAKTFWINEAGTPLEIISINDTPIEVLINERLKEIGGGTSEWKRYKATKRIMISDKAGDVIIKARDEQGKIIEIKDQFIKNENKRFEIIVENGIAREYRRDDYIEGKMLDGDIALINIKSWGGKINIDGKNIVKLVEEELENLKMCKSIILDVRENDGGNSHYARLVASHFLKEKVDVCNFLVKKPGQNEMIREYAKIGPEGEYYDQKLVILTGPKGISSTDMFLTFLKDIGRAVSIGQATGGGSGNPQIFNLHLGDREFDLWVSCWRNYRNNGQEIENNGIEPDIFVEPTPEDVRNHRDVELERAIKYLNN